MPTTTRTTTASFEDVDDYLSRLGALLDLMNAASELGEADADYVGQLHRRPGPELRRVRRSAARRRFRRSSTQRAKQVARKCCSSGCSYQDIQSLC